MAEPTYLLVAGNGKTSRNNVEALLNDYVVLLRQRKNEPIIVLVYDDKPSEGQVWASQYAKDEGLSCVVYTRKNASTMAVQSATLYESETPYKEASKLVKGESMAYGFLLWDDEDQSCFDALSTFSSKGIGCYDLTNGLYDIAPAAGLKPVTTPQPPVQEQIVPKAQEEPEEAVEAEEDDSEDDEEDEEDDIADDMEEVYFAFENLGKIMARGFFAEFRALMENDKK